MDCESTQPETLLQVVRALADSGQIARLSGIQAKLLLAFIAHANYRTREAHPSADTLAVMAGSSNMSWTRKALHELRESGILSVVQDSRGRRSLVRRLECPTGSGNDCVSSESTSPYHDRVEDATGSLTDRVGMESTGSDCDPVETRNPVIAERQPGQAMTPEQSEQSNSYIPKEVESGKSGTSAKAKRQRAVDASSVEIPEPIRSDDFRKVWGQWIEHRREIRKPLGPTAANKQLAKLAQWGIERSIAAIEHSIMRGWMGIFEAPADQIEGQSATGIRMRPISPRRAAQEQAMREMAEEFMR